MTGTPNAHTPSAEKAQITHGLADALAGLIRDQLRSVEDRHQAYRQQAEALIADLRARVSHYEALVVAVREQTLAATTERMTALADEWVEAERQADEHGPRHAYTGYDCAEMLRDVVSSPAKEADDA